MQHVKRYHKGKPTKIRSKNMPDCPVPFDPYETVYQHDYKSKTSRKPDSFREGAWYEHTRNNPQPDEIFMVHHLNRKEIQRVPTPLMYWNKHPNEKETRQLLSAEFCTEYQKKFTAGNKAPEPKPVLPRPVEQKKEIPHLLITEFRDRYRSPCVHNLLISSTARYGSNATRDIPPKGIVPAVTYAHIKNQENRRKLTTYCEHYGNAHDDLVSFLKSMDTEAIHRELASSDPSETKAIRTFLESVTSPCVTPPKPKIC